MRFGNFGQRVVVVSGLPAAREGRPDEGASAAMITMKHHEDKQFRVSDLIDANHVIKELKNTQDIVAKVSPLELGHIVWVIISDALSLKHSDGKSQGGCTGAGQSGVHRWQGGDVQHAAMGIESYSEVRTVIAWQRGHGVGRRARKVRVASGYVLGTRCWAGRLCSDITEGTDMTRPWQWFAAAPMSVESPTELVVDAKGLYDHLHRPAATAGSHERRTSLDIKMMTRSVRCLRSKVRWIHGDIMLSDCLTKRTGQATLMRWAMSRRGGSGPPG